YIFWYKSKGFDFRLFSKFINDFLDNFNLFPLSVNLNQPLLFLKTNKSLFCPNKTIFSIRLEKCSFLFFSSGFKFSRTILSILKQSKSFISLIIKSMYFIISLSFICQMWHNILALGAVADFGASAAADQPSTNVDR